MGFAVDASGHCLNLKIHHVVDSPVGSALVGFFALKWNRQYQTTPGKGSFIVGENLCEGMVAAGKSSYVLAARNPNLGVPGGFANLDFIVDIKQLRVQRTLKE